MTQNELHNEDLNRRAERLERNLERHQAINLKEQERRVASANQDSNITQIVHIMYYTVGILELLLAVRVILHLLSADPASPFAGFIYRLSYPFVALFANLVPNTVVGTTGVLEITSLIAMFIWAIFTWLVGRIFLSSRSRPSST